MSALRELFALIKVHPWLLPQTIGIVVAVAVAVVIVPAAGIVGFFYIKTPCGYPFELFAVTIFDKPSCHNTGTITVSAVDDRLEVFVNGHLRGHFPSKDGSTTISFAPWIRAGSNEVVLRLTNGPGSWKMDATVAADGFLSSHCIRGDSAPENQLAITGKVSLQANDSEIITAIFPCEYQE